MTINKKEDANLQKITCPDCGSESVATSPEEQTFLYGSKGVSLRALIPLRTCQICEFQFTDYEAENAREDAIRKYLGVPSPEEIQSIRKMYDMTRAAFAELTGIGEASLGRWEAGSLMPSVANARYLFLLRNPENVHRLRDRFLGISTDNQNKSMDLPHRCRAFRAIEHRIESLHQCASKWKLRKTTGA